MEEVGRIERALFVNDSKATNADAAEKALASFDDIYWIIGGKAKEGGIEPLRPYFPRDPQGLSDRRGERRFRAHARGRACPTSVAGRSTSRRSARRATRSTSDAAEPVVLLSPACASYDQFANFEVRGDAFRELVQRLCPPSSPPVEEDVS